MNLRTIYTFFFSLLAVTLIFFFTGFAGGPAASNDQGYTGAPGETGTVCGNCHNLIGSYGFVNIDLVSNIGTLPYEFLPNLPITMDITINTTSGFPNAYGFQLIMMDDVGNPLNVNYTNFSPNIKQSTLTNGRTYLEHNEPSATNTFSFDYEIIIAGPIDIPEPVKVYVTATAVNGNGFNSGDSGSTGFVFDLLLFRLPVELSDFNATPNLTDIRLDWTTETEQDNDYFAVEYSTNGSNFTTIKTITGAGTTDTRNTYAYTHATPAIGDNYYRLRMVDFDAKETFSEVVTAKFTNKFDGVTVFPQPAATEATIYLTSPANESGTIQVYDISGKLIYSNDIQLIKGENYVNLHCENWIAGHYVIQIEGQQLGTETIQFLKQ